MAIDEEAAFSTYMQQLSAGLGAAAAANAECMMPSGTDKEMKKLSESILQVAHLPKDAKARQRKELEEIIYEIDSILQLFPLKGGSDMMPCDRRANPRTAQEVKAIRTRIDKILKKPQFLSSHIPSTDHGMSKMTVSQSPVEPVILLGKAEDHKEKIIELLLSVKETGQAGACIIPIDRKGGAGTTELARAIFDDKRVARHFRRKLWVNAAELVDSKKLSGLISKPASTMFWVHKTLNLDMEEEQVLVVLDDIRNKNAVYKKAYIKERKKKPCTYIDEAEGRRKVVLSSYQPRYYGFDRDQGSSRPMERLSKKDSWMLFKECAFAHRSGDVHPPQLEAIGENIVEHLQGSRAMISRIGSMLSEKHELSYWKLIQESRVWMLPLDGEVVQWIVGFCYHPRR